MSRKAATSLEFFEDEKAQVWALDRETGDPVYLPNGKADEMRERAKTSLKCLVPECDQPISTRGGSRRHHFFHVNGNPHSGESLHHFASKAMIEEWANRTYPRLVVTPEKTIKTDTIHRRPDLMIEDRKGKHRVALEVEYKNWSREEFRAKDAELTGEGIVTSWIAGHTTVKPTAKTKKVGGKFPRIANVEPNWLAREIAFRAAHVEQDDDGKFVEFGEGHTGFQFPLVINPITREIGTLVNHRNPKSNKLLGSDTVPCHRENRPLSEPPYDLIVCDIDECEIDPEIGLVTPIMQKIIEDEKAYRSKHGHRKSDPYVTEDASKVADDYLNSADSMFPSLKGDAIVSDAGEGEGQEKVAPELSDEERAARIEQMWDSHMRDDAMLVMGDPLPAVINTTDRFAEAIYVKPQVWRSLVLREFIWRNHDKHFKVSDVERLLRDEHFIPMSENSVERFRAIKRFLDLLVREGYCRPGAGKYEFVSNHEDETFVPVSKRKGEERARRKASSVSGRRVPADDKTSLGKAVRSVLEAREQRRNGIVKPPQPASAPDPEKERQSEAYDRSEVRQHFIARYGEVPKCVSWSYSLHCDPVRALTEHWRGVIVMELIEECSEGVEITVSDCMAILTAYEIELADGASEVIEHYLDNLRSRGILRRDDDGRLRRTGVSIA